MLRFFGVVLATAVLAAANLVANGQEPPGDAPVNREQIEAALKLTADAAGKYEFQVADGDDKPALIPKPILRWSNPVVGEIHGNVFLWTAGGRPAVVGSLFKWFTPHTHMSHEFHSLCEAPLAGKYEGTEVWRTSVGGVRFLPLDEAPAPAATAPQRLLQVRRLASEFSVTKNERDGSRQELRLLSQPVYRYSAPEKQIHDGALFVFVQGTDPEVFLLLEARGQSDAPEWSFAAARMNSVGFQVRRHDQEVWSVEIMPWRDIGSHAEIYTTFGFDNVVISEGGKAAR
jgi:hypothetical protein